jgi:hypothetical protein
VRLKKLLIFLFLIAGDLAVRAEAPTPDFSEGFRKLAALGMPALDAKAQWSQVPQSNGQIYQLQQLARSFKGNAWLLPSTDGKIRFVPLGGMEIVEIDPSEKREPAWRGGSGRNAKPTIFPDPSKDAEALITGIQKTAEKSQSDDPFSITSRGSGFGDLLLFATQLHQTGHTDLANRLAMATFGIFPTREAAVDAAVDQLAEQSYDKATQAFFSSGEWPVYHRALTSLANRFPRGWANGAAVAMFLPQLEKQANGTKATVPSLPGIDLDPAALTIAREFTEKPADSQKPNDSEESSTMSPEQIYQRQMMGRFGGDGRGSTPLWVIAGQSDTDQETSPSARMMKLKMAALPVLAALATDPFLTHEPNASSYSRHYSSNESDEERTLNAYENLHRPSTRGEIARRLLVATLPDPQDDLARADPESIRDLALSFWKEHKNSSPEEIAAVFLSDGSNRQSSQASTILASSANPKAHQIFESHVLASEDAVARFQEVQTYLRTRKAAAKTFFATYAKLVRSQNAGLSEDDQSRSESSWMIKQAGGVEKIIKQLEGLVGEQSPRALAVQIAKGKAEDAEPAINALSELLTEASPTKHLFALLEGAFAATEASIRARFLRATFSIQWNKDREQKDDESPLPDRKISDPEAAVWRKLIADTREVPAKVFRSSGNEERSSVADLAAFALNYSISPLDRNEVQIASVILSKPVSAILLERATARLAGEPIPPLPDASRVSQERLAEIVAGAGKKPSSEVASHLVSLTPDERAAWLEWFNDPGDLPLPDSVRELQSIITSRSSNVFLNAKDVKGAGNIDVGFKLSPESLTRHIESIAPDIEKHSRTVIMISPAYFGPGLEILATVVPVPEEKANDEAKGEDEEDDSASAARYWQQYFSRTAKMLETHQEADGMVFVQLQGENQSQEFWSIQKGKATLQAADPDDNSDPESVSTALKAILEAKGPQRFRIQIQILSRADAAKFSNSND